MAKEVENVLLYQLQRITETMLRHVEVMKVVYLLDNIRHIGMIVTNATIRTRSCLGSVVALPLHILPLDLEVGHPLLVDGGLLLVGGPGPVHRARAAGLSSG